MPSLFRPKYTKVDPATGETVTRQTRKWYGKYHDANGLVQRVPLCTDKTAAQAMLIELVRTAERQIAGLIDPAADQLARPLIEHIEEYRTHLLAKARSEKHISETIRLISRVVDDCRCRILTDLQAGGEKIEQHLAQRREEGSSHRTINADLIAVRSFCRWLIEKGRMRGDPTRGLHRLNVETDRRLERHALTDAEARRLIDAAFRSTRVFKNLTGEDRAVMYTLAQRTGLRRKELRSLKPSSFDLQSSPPTVRVEAASSKRRRRDVLPLPKDVAETMAEYFACRPPAERVWSGSWWRRSAEMLRLDLAEAGISPVDNEGRIVDFHGQRTTFITALARAGVPPATTQRLARHSDINLTLGPYTQLEMADMAGAVEKLSELRRSPDRPEEGASPAPAVEKQTESDPALGKIARAWPSLPEHIRQTILVLVETAFGTRPQP